MRRNVISISGPIRVRTREILPIFILFTLILLLAGFRFPEEAGAAGFSTQVPEGEEANRDSWQQPDKVMDAIGVRPGMTVGEVGAGYGYFTFKLAGRVGETGLIYANDIKRNALRSIEETARRRNIKHIMTILGDTADPRFPPATMDLVIMVYVFHELAKPVELLQNLKPSLKPNAPVVILERDPEKMGSAGRHFYKKDKILRLVDEAGFDLVRVETFLPRDNIYILREKGLHSSPANPGEGPMEEKTKLPRITHYDLRLHLFPKENNLIAEASMTVRNTTSETISEIPFILYRLFDVEEVTDGQGRPLSARRTVVKFSDEKSLQVSFVVVRLDRPLPLGESAVVRMNYAGAMWGYPEVMAYVRDRIDENYSLVRPDSLAYPMLASPSFQGMMEAFRSAFTYRVEVEVPDGLIVACGGRPVSTQRKAGTTVFLFESFKPTWRLDVAAAKFKVVEDKNSGIRIYVIPGDEAEAPRIFETAKKSFRFFTELLGDVGDFPGFTIIEVPEGWGGQAADFYILQPAAAFRDKSRTSELYHEIAHNWNARADPGIQRCRYFDEAFTSYFEGLAIREFEGEEAFKAYMDRRRDQFLRAGERDEKNFTTSIADYWKEERGSNSYTKGAWSLYVLHRAFGEEDFLKLVSGFVHEYRVRPADFKDFQVFAEKTVGKSLDAFFKEWIYGVESSRQLREKFEISQIAARYRQEAAAPL